MTRLGYNQGGKYSSRAFRRGATQEIKDSGPTLALIIQSGTWTRAGYKSYLGLQADYAVNISRFVLDAIGSDSDEPDESGPRNERKMRKRLRGSPSPSSTLGAVN